MEENKMSDDDGQNGSFEMIIDDNLADDTSNNNNGKYKHKPTPSRILVNDHFPTFGKNYSGSKRPYLGDFHKIPVLIPLTNSIQLNAHM